MLGSRLTKLRKQRKLTQQQVADNLHISRGTYAQYEIDRRIPEYGTLEKMADFFEVSIDHLVGRDEPNKLPLDGLDEKQKKILDELKNLSADDIEFIHGVIERIKKK